MSLARTVLGDIDSSELGFTMAHEHVFLDVGGHGSPDIEWSLWRWEEQLDMVKKYKANGGGTLIDANPMSYDGRDVARLYTMSKQTGVHIIACTGFVKAKPNFENCQALAKMDVAQMTKFFVGEIEDGIDGTDIKAGWIKGASMYMYITDIQERALRAGARAAMGGPERAGRELNTSRHIVY